MPGSRRSKRVEVRPGQTAVAPNVDHPRGFAVRNASGRPLSVTFRFDVEAHVMTVVIEEPRTVRRSPGEAGAGGFLQPPPDQPA